MDSVSEVLALNSYGNSPIMGLAVTHRVPMANPPVERDRLPASPAGSLRGFAASAAPHLARYAA